jgi:hypothetical protein
MRRADVCLLLAAGLLLGSLCSCGGSRDQPGGEAATWTVDPDNPPTKDAVRISAQVSRVECAGGETGRVLTPTVKEDRARVIVTFMVERNEDGDATCPGNKIVASMFELNGPLDGRALFDGGCVAVTSGQARECEPRQVWPTIR